MSCDPNNGIINACLKFRSIYRVMVLFVRFTFENLNISIVAGWLERWCGVSEFEGSIMAKGKVNGNSREVNWYESWGIEVLEFKNKEIGAAIFFRNFSCRNCFYPIKVYEM